MVLAGRERGATNDVLHMLRDDLFVADAVLHGTDSAVLVEGASNLRDRAAGVNGLGGDDAIVAARKFLGVAGGVEFRGEIHGSGNAQPVVADGFNVIFPDVVGPDFGLAFLGEVRGEDATDCAASDDANFQQSHTPRVRLSQIAEVFLTLSRVSPPLKNFHGTSARHSPSVLPIR